MKDTSPEGFKSIDLDRVIETTKQAMSEVGFDQEMVPVLFNVWRTSYPCKK